MTLTNPAEAHVVKTVTVDSTNAAAITIEDFVRYEVFVIEASLTSAPTARATITVPNIARRVVFFVNDLSFDAVVTVSGQSATAGVISPSDTGVFAADEFGIRQTGSDFPVFAGVKINNASDLTTFDMSAGAAVTFDTEAFDTHGFHEGVTNPERITIPAEFAGYYVNLTANVRVQLITADTIINMNIREDGATSRASGTNHVGTTTVEMNIATGPIQVSSGTYFEMLPASVDTSVTLHAGRTIFALRVIGR